MPTKRRARPKTIFAVSDGRGETASQVIRAATLQFADRKYRLVRRGGIRTDAQVARVVARAAEANAVVFYTLVSAVTRRAMRQFARQRQVRAVDVLGPAFTALDELFGGRRGSTPGLLYAMERARLDRMEAIDYTLKHDDGQRVHELPAADVVLVGVSRTSKSSTCFFLAYEGVRAANVPLVPGLPPPAPLLRLAPEKVIGLRANVSRLLTIREARASTLRLGQTDPYIDQRTVAREVAAADRMIAEHGWRTVDVSYMAIEEISREVLRLAGSVGESSW